MRDQPTYELAESANAHSLQRLVSHHGRTHLDLFSGIGGFALAAASAGFKTIGFSEIEPYACKILKHHWPDVPNHGDIRNLRGIRADLITGGFPCQPFSSSGRKLGKGDDRFLWPEMRRVISESKPAWVLCENVALFASMALGQVLSDLENMGYQTATFCIPACGVNAPHKRDRIYIVADANSERLEGRTRTELQGEMPRPANCCRWEGHDGWKTKSRLDRVDDGLPNRVDRLKALGNAIVPQVATEILRNLVMANDGTHAPRKEKL
jgi:DNA (cytosine-5)-methyltransferase 1